MDERIDALLALQHADGNWGVGVYDSQDWDSTTDALWLLHELAAPVEDERVRRAIDLVHEQVVWDVGMPFFDGETEACINGRVLTIGAGFGHPSSSLAQRLLGEQLADGGWNCDAPESTRGSFHPTICVLEGLLAFERATGPDEAIDAARHRGEEYLLERGLLHRLSTGEVLDQAWLVPRAPTYWCYDALRELDHLRDAGVEPDGRIVDAIESLLRARREDGTWAAASSIEAEQVLELEPIGGPSALIAERALRVFAWAEG